METRANYAVIGLFTLAVIAGAFGFIFWFSGRDGASQRLQYDIVFDGSVSGLSRGASVLFNGLRKGEVTAIRLDPDNPHRVLATIAVEPDTPVRADTEAKLEYQGLTGIASIQLSGGKPDAAAVKPEKAGDRPKISARRSDFQDILSTVQRLAMRTDDVLGRAEKLIADNEGPVGRTIRNVESFTDALAKNSDGVNRFLSSTAGAADRIAALSTSVEEIVKAIEPGRVGKIVADIEAVTGTLASGREEIASTLRDVAALGRRLGEFGNRIDSVLADAGALVRSVDPAVIGRAVENADRFIAVLGANTERFEALIRDAGSIAGRVDRFVATLDQNRDEVAALLKDGASLARRLNETAPKLDAALADIGAVAKAFDPAKIGRTIDNVDRFMVALGANTERLEALVRDAGSIAGRIDRFAATLDQNRDEVATLLKDGASLARRLNETAPKLDAALADIGAVAKAVDPAKIGRAIDNVDRFMVALGDNRERVDKALKDLASIAERADRFATTLDLNRDEVARLLKEGASLAERLNATAPKLDTALAEFGGLVRAIDPLKVGRFVDNIDSFTQTLALNRDNLDKTLKDAPSITGKLDVAATKLDQVLTSAQNLLGSAGGTDTKGLIAELTDAARAIRVLAGNLDGRTAEITTGINRFTGPALRDYQALAVDGRRTLGDIQRVMRSLEKNPQQLILGGRPPIPEFQGRR